MEEDKVPRVLYMNLGTTRPRGRPRNRWQDGRMVGGEEWQEKVYDGEEWKKLLRTARNHCIPHMPMEQNRTINHNSNFHSSKGAPETQYSSFNMEFILQKS
jgi:hypothetical protein